MTGENKKRRGGGWAPLTGVVLEERKERDDKTKTEQIRPQKSHHGRHRAKGVLVKRLEEERNKNATRGGRKDHFGERKKKL